MKNDNQNQISEEKAKEVLIKENKQRIEKCTKELQAVLEKYNCILDVSIQLKLNQVIPSIAIVSK